MTFIKYLQSLEKITTRNVNCNLQNSTFRNGKFFIGDRLYTLTFIIENIKTQKENIDIFNYLKENHPEDLI